MAMISIVKDTLTDGSVVFDLLIQNEGESIKVQLPSIDGEQSRIERKVNEFHIAFEKLLGETVSWGDMLGADAGRSE